MSDILICPVCRKKLTINEKSLKCKNNHSFDFAKEGYVNLLLGSKSGDKKGDSKESARARRSFLSKDYYKCLKKAINERMHGTVLDICCGEGYYDDYDGELYGFDISKEMVRLASKKNKANNYFVANIADIPVADSSIDTAFHLFAPFNDKEFSRVLKDNGVLYSVIPGENHLFEMKQVLYEQPYLNDEKAPESKYMNLKSRTKISEKIHIKRDDLLELFSMTPYFYHTSDDDKKKLSDIEVIDLTIEFVILEYIKIK